MIWGGSPYDSGRSPCDSGRAPHDSESGRLMIPEGPCTEIPPVCSRHFFVWFWNFPFKKVENRKHRNGAFLGPGNAQKILKNCVFGAGPGLFGEKTWKGGTG